MIFDPDLHDLAIGVIIHAANAAAAVTDRVHAGLADCRNQIVHALGCKFQFSGRRLNSMPQIAERLRTQIDFVNDGNQCLRQIAHAVAQAKLAPQ